MITASKTIRDLSRGLCLFVFMTLLINTAFADSLPFKDNNKLTFQILKNGEPVEDFDSVQIEIYNSYVDTIAIITHLTENRYYRYFHNNDEYGFTSRLGNDNFNVVVFQDGKRIESGRIENNRSALFYRFELKDDKLELLPRPIRIKTSDYLMFLLITLALEILIALLFFRKAILKHKKIGFFILTFIGLNCITHFLVWVAYSHTTIQVLTLEFFVVAAEFLYWKFIIGLSTRKSILASFLTNFVSFLFGVIPHLFINK